VCWVRATRNQALSLSTFSLDLFLPPGTAAPADILDAGLPSEALVLEVPIALTQTLTLEAADVALESERSGLKEKALGRTLDYRVGT
jgi:hypothetical protein